MIGLRDVSAPGSWWSSASDDSVGVWVDGGLAIVHDASASNNASFMSRRVCKRRTRRHVPGTTVQLRDASWGVPWIANPPRHTRRDSYTLDREASFATRTHAAGDADRPGRHPPTPRAS